MVRSGLACSRFGDEPSCADSNTGRSRGDPSGHDDAHAATYASTWTAMAGGFFNMADTSPPDPGHLPIRP